MIISDAEKFKADESKNWERLDAKIELENCLFTTNPTANNTEMKLREE
jgi:hypothetical protein